MSGQATGWLLRHGPRPDDVDRDGKPYGLARARALRAVLAPVADAANRDGLHAHPGLDAIIDGSLYSRRQVLRVLADGVAEGWLEAESEGGGRGNATVYRLRYDRRKGATMTPFPAETVPSDPGKGAITVPSDDTLSESAPPVLSTDNGKAQQERASRSAPRSLLPADFEPSSALLEWASREVPGMDARAETAKFVDHWVSKAERRADWPAAWRNWMRRAAEFASQRNGNGRARSGPQWQPDTPDDQRRRDLPTEELFL